ncbi:HupE/UreJ family protein [Mesorhizobium sp. M4A.F.Ca.ET.022.05.2.1]|uniref:HupE/UreJ family protein n=1 Tax=Mesorhizobium sp. M4A.F.Ca.ET.022.05.2.1 TaxID=2496653 RepID=UPI000FCC4596|nr:HupE/UreJ family protein [Mesorhizobium sp. M4A.F.Ca.ET.022.05.2.1]RVC83994.1 HupE/UreJ family protein [Mesorhizobium sp. M4A.F.Ca.ET.022.05.2.1]
MISNGTKFGVVLAFVASMPAIASAHTGVGDTSGFLHGISHPICGVDHILAMVMVGLFAYQLGGRALWLIPTMFVLMMALGGALGASSAYLPHAELGIALSVIVLGGIVALKVKAPVGIATGVVGCFAIFHGYAHGAEMPENASGFAYAAGFMIATALLHATGIAVSFQIEKASERYSRVVMQCAEGIAALAGFGFLTGVF